jgi:hypothetical protein
MEITVICTGRGSHKRHMFNRLSLDGDGQVAVQPFRIANMPELAAVEFDGVAIETQAVMPPAYEPRTSKGWRWKCPRCGVDRRFTFESLVTWIGERRVADISHPA